MRAFQVPGRARASGTISAMKTQKELWAEYERLKAEERYEEAGKVLDLIEPISDEAWRRILDEAPPEDELLSQKETERLAELTAALDRTVGRQAG